MRDTECLKATLNVCSHGENIVKFVEFDKLASKLIAKLPV